ncbi:MAG: molybdopterin-synthase adenylyltransferase MoeB [Verrucomicrobiae bacterium]|nr:molybdopterin-synthase adenylyltransferase MoeB [Verrucomicrobiae bacterium]
MQPIVANGSFLTDEELVRYSRQLILPELGQQGQRRLKAARVLVVGAGGLGSPLALYLAAAGVGTLGIADGDCVETSNLHRQLLHATPDVGKSKLESARQKLLALNPHVQVVLHPTRLAAANAQEILGDYDVVADGTDNFPARYLVNDACVLLRKPNVHGAIYRFEGMASVFAPHLGGPCYRCWYPEPPPDGAVPSCAEAGVLGALCGIIGSIQAMEVIKLVVGAGEPLLGRLLRIDALTMRFREHRIARDPCCPVCGEQPAITELRDIAGGCSPDDLGVEELEAMRRRKEDFLLVDVRDPAEVAVAEIPGSFKLPLPELRRRFGELPKDRLIVLHCQSGVRSRRALQFLRAQGFTRVKNLAGGIEAWQRHFRQ